MRFTVINPTLDVDAYEAFDFEGSAGSPERRLLAAILERSILDYVGNDPNEVEEASQWIFSSADELTHYSFAWICQELGIDKVKISRMIKDMPKRGKHRIAPWYFTKHAS